MGRYLLKRLLRGILSIIAIVVIVMILVYTLIDKDTIINNTDQTYAKSYNNAKVTYKYSKWEEYGYIYYVNYSEFLALSTSNGDITEAERDQAKLGKKAGDEENYFIAEDDSVMAQQMVKKFVETYQKKGYTITRLKQVNNPGKTTVAKGGSAQLFAFRNISLATRAWKYFARLIHVDNIHYASGIADADRKITFTLFDPLYQKDGKKVFAPAIMGNGTEHKYLLYTDGKFPFIHQNLISIQLGTSTSLNKDVEVWTTMTKKQGKLVVEDRLYPSGVVESSSDNLHSLRYSEGSWNPINAVNYRRFVDDYTVVDAQLNGLSPMAYSFIIGIISVAIEYILGVPLGIWMARRKDKLVDKIGTIYIIFIIAVPSLAYIYMFRALGSAVGLPTTFFTDEVNFAKYGNTIYILPIISLALPGIAGLMKWIRRYMIDQQNSDYVKFARSEGMSEREIFSKHIAKNALVPIVHGIPGTILGALTGAVITERIYSTPGVGQVLTKAINASDNAVIVGITLFYAVLSVVSIILGDIAMALADPRIKFTSRGR